MEVFNFQPRGEVKRNIQFLDRTIDFENGAFQVQQVAVNPIITFEMTFEGTSKTLSELEDFYLKHRKTKRFMFFYFGREYICQFTSNYNPTESLGFSNKNKVIGKVSVTLTMRVVNLNSDNPIGNYIWNCIGNTLIPSSNVLYHVGNQSLVIPVDSCYLNKRDNLVGIPQ